MNRKCGFAMAFAFVLTLVAASGPAVAADEQARQQAMTEFSQSANAIQRDIDARQMELSTIMNSASPDKARIQELFRDIGELRGKLVAAQVELENKLGGPNAAPYGQFGMHHNGEFGPGGPGFGGGYGHRGMMRHGGHHGGW